MITVKITKGLRYSINGVEKLCVGVRDCSDECGDAVLAVFDDCCPDEYFKSALNIYGNKGDLK